MKNNPNYFSVKSSLSWDEYFMLQAMMASFKSKDPTTKVGSVFVDSNNHQLTMGYNGFVAGIDENLLPWGKEKEQSLEHQKYAYVVHSEANAILHSSKNLEGSRCYVTLFPCHECAKLLASSKVGELIYMSNKHEDTEGSRISRKIFDLAGVKYRQLIPSKELLEKLHKHFLNQISQI